MCVSAPRGLPLLAALAISAAGCVAPLPSARTAQTTAQNRAPAAQDVIARMDVTGPRGRLDREQRMRLLERIGREGGASPLKRQLAAMAGFGDVDLYAGNAARLLIDGPATFDAMFSSIARARSSILLESYIIDDAKIAQDLAALLIRKRAEGVSVALIHDAVGSIGTPGDYFDTLRAAGVAVCEFNPLSPLRKRRYQDITHRDHRKILVVDREVAYTGGVNISAVYSSGSFGRTARAPEQNGWRDTQIELRGPAAAALDDLVRDTWRSQHCEPALPEPAGSAADKAAGPHTVRIVPSSPEDGQSRIYTMLLTAIDAASRSVHLTMAYFAPGQDMVDALADAARRGVDVQLVLPSVSDFSPVLHAGRSYYQELLDAGVHIHELQDAVLHSKTAVIDGVLSTVGSSNMDWRSFVANNEVNAVVFGEDFGDAMTRMFERDVAASQTVDAQTWRRRPLWPRLQERAARLFERWW
ncbi:phospholipase D-like domain-containing protein [Methyloversatilis discipulorum]|uniref:phospholipase D-like domain-containing protein n=1 Tax=Methyloversatilis discipulorum TaxID=1119528 RepID=UPI001A5B6A35|nr:phospholipase D-like domain-containing protein [Methyloversatilis discipulorum]MBL8467281.1 cardiolipin synthase B [Methyloversatilis discipulorum]